MPGHLPTKLVLNFILPAKLEAWVELECPGDRTRSFSVRLALFERRRLTILKIYLSLFYEHCLTCNCICSLITQLIALQHPCKMCGILIIFSMHSMSADLSHTMTIWSIVSANYVASWSESLVTSIIEIGAGGSNVCEKPRYYSYWLKRSYYNITGNIITQYSPLSNVDGLATIKQHDCEL